MVPCWSKSTHVHKHPLLLFFLVRNLDLFLKTSKIQPRFLSLRTEQPFKTLRHFNDAIQAR